MPCCVSAYCLYVVVLLRYYRTVSCAGVVCDSAGRRAGMTSLYCKLARKIRTKLFFQGFSLEKIQKNCFQLDE